MQSHVAIPNYIISCIEQLRQKIADPNFLERHRQKPTDFTRRRKLPFDTVVLLVLQKTTQSIQRHLDAFFCQAIWVLHLDLSWVTAGAWTQARAKLKASAFDELNYQVVVPTIYGPKHKAKRRYWRGLRLVATDGSTVNVPATKKIGRHFRVFRTAPAGKRGQLRGLARMSLLYDLLNRVVLDAQLVSDKVGEITLALQHIGHLEPNDLVLMDAGYRGYLLLAALMAAKAHFVVRCSKGGFFEARKLFRENKSGLSRKIVLYPDKKVIRQCRKLGLPMSLHVRLVTVRLSDGKLEVLATSLMDTKRFPTARFKKLYSLRWGEETLYTLLKSRLDLENWTGLSFGAIQQDFAATMLLSNLESLLTQPAAQVLEKKSAQTKRPLQPNRANCYHALKHHLLQLLGSQLPVKEVVRILQTLFLHSPVSVRKRRRAPRKKLSAASSLSYQRYRKKVVF
jgi:hypothetical protein